jgi:hypothetical protein
MRRVSLLTVVIVSLLTLCMFSYSHSVSAKNPGSYVYSDTDLTRADWTEDNFPNRGFERWNFPSAS